MKLLLCFSGSVASIKAMPLIEQLNRVEGVSFGLVYSISASFEIICIVSMRFVLLIGPVVVSMRVGSLGTARIARDCDRGGLSFH